MDPKARGLYKDYNYSNSQKLPIGHFYLNMRKDGVKRNYSG